MGPYASDKFRSYSPYSFDSFLPELFVNILYDSSQKGYF